MAGVRHDVWELRLHGMAGERHGMCELVFIVPLVLPFVVEGTNSVMSTTESGQINVHSEMSSLLSNAVVIMSQRYSISTLWLANDNRGDRIV
jgi:ABC-type molybdate transport system permease subunit